MLFAARDMNDLQQCSSAALRNGFFNGLLLIDSRGKALDIAGAVKVRGVGRFFGFDILLNQRIEVELVAAGPEREVDVEQVRGLVLAAFDGPQEWRSANDFDELVALANGAKTIAEIASIMMRW
jgi:hypothetical protein